MMLKTETVAPTPSARVNTTEEANPRLFLRRRTAWRISMKYIFKVSRCEAETLIIGPLSDAHAISSSLTAPHRLRKMKPRIQPSLNDRPDHLALPHRRKARRRRHGRGLQSRRHRTRPLRRPQIPPRRTLS